MKYTKRRPILIFLALCGLFYLCGTVVLPLCTASGAIFSGEAVFARAAPIDLPDMTLFSALPLSLEAAPDAPSPVSSPPPSATPEETDFAAFSAEPATEGGALQIKNSTSYTFNTEELLAAPFSLRQGQPKVLIVHTHTSEAYAQSEGYTYTPSDAYRTEDAEYNICRVGRALAESLEAHGISAIHDTTSHDYPSYSGCYGRSLETIEKNLALYQAIDVVIDLHRDAISDSDGGYLKTAAEIDGKTAAQALVVVGTDAGGLPHPNWQKNLSLGLKVQKTLCDLYPGLARPLHLRTERFNGHASEGTLLIEIGSNGNTMDEALYCAELVGRALAETLLPLMP